MLDPARRASLVDRLTEGMSQAWSGAHVEPRGSLAEPGGGDPLSDIDLRLSVAGNVFEACIRTMQQTLDRIQPVRLFRIDPDAPASSYSRLVYVLFHDVPMFWRLDLEIVGRPPVPSPEAAPFWAPWSLPASALMNALAAMKAAARGGDATANELLARAFERLGERLPALETGERIRALASVCKAHDPSLQDLAEEVAEWSQALRV